MPNRTIRDKNLIKIMESEPGHQRPARTLPWDR